MEVRKEKRVFFSSRSYCTIPTNTVDKKTKAIFKVISEDRKKEIRKTIRVSFLGFFLEILATFVRYKRIYRNQGKPRNQLFTC